MRIIGTRIALPRDAKHDFYSVAATEAGKNNGKPTFENSRDLWGEATFLVPAGKSAALVVVSIISPTLQVA